MLGSRFDFIPDKIVQTHLDRAFDLVLELLALSEAKNYSSELRSSFRKTIIIYTASIIEVLLLLILKSKKSEDDCSELKDTIARTLYKINEMERIALVEKKSQSVKFNKLNLDQVNKLCKEHKLVDLNLFSRVNDVRELRNRQHLGGLEEIEVTYTKKDLEFVFSVAKDVADLSEEMLLAAD